MKPDLFEKLESGTSRGPLICIALLLALAALCFGFASYARLKDGPHAQQHRVTLTNALAADLPR